MNDKTVHFLSVVLGIFFLVFGLLVTLVALTALFGTGTAMVATDMAQRMGRDVGAFPFVYAFGGGFLTAILGVCYFVAAYGLLKFKKWAYKVVAAVGVVGVVTTTFSFSFSSPSYFELFWSIVYLTFAYVMSTKPKMFKN